MYELLALHEAEQGGRVFHTATLSVGGESYPIDDQFGSWRVHVDGKVRDLLPPVAADLQAEVKAADKRRARESQ